MKVKLIPLLGLNIYIYIYIYIGVCTMFIVFIINLANLKINYQSQSQEKVQHMPIILK